MYEKGKGVPKDRKKAQELYGRVYVLYKKEAEQGRAWAQYDLGRMYERGQGVKRDKKEAITWYEKAAEQDIKPAKKALKRLKRWV